MYKRIKEIRKELKLSQEDFGKKIGLSQSTLAMIEVGKRNFNDKHVKLICSTFNVSEQWLRTGIGDMFLASPYEKEFMDIFKNLTPITQKYLYEMAKNLLENEKSLIGSTKESEGDYIKDCSNVAKEAKLPIWNTGEEEDSNVSNL